MIYLSRIYGMFLMNKYLSFVLFLYLHTYFAADNVAAVAASVVVVAFDKWQVAADIVA